MSVVVGVLEISLALDHAHSLKEKRSVVRSLVERTRNKFNVSGAEVDDNDRHNRARLGFSAVANDGPFVNSVLDKVLAFVEDQAIGRAEILDSRLELIHV